MAQNSATRRVIKRLTRPLLSESAYAFVQSLVTVRDIRSGSWYEPEIDLLGAGIEAGEHAVDVGANCGLYSYYLSRAVGDRGKVYAFEPIAFTAGVLGRVVRKLGLGNVVIHTSGCGEEPGSVEFMLPIQESGAIISGLVHERPSAHPARQDQRVECRPVVRLDDVISDPHRISFMKVDVEGAELKVLRGARNILATGKPTCICEVNPEFLGRYEHSCADLANFMDEYGYVPYSYEGGRLTATQPNAKANYVFLHPDRAARFAAILTTRPENAPQANG